MINTKITIDRDELVKFINKFHLRGLVNSAEITFSNKKISAIFSNNLKNLSGKVTMPIQYSGELVKLGVFNIGTLLAMVESFISRKENEIILECCTIRPFDKSIQKLKISNGKRELFFFGAALSLIKKNSDINSKISQDFTGNISSEIIRELLKAIKALNILKATFFFEQQDSIVQITFSEFGISMSFTLSGKVLTNFKTTKRFSPEVLKNILIINKYCESAKVVISSGQYIKFRFKEQGIVSFYLFEIMKRNISDDN